MAQIGFLHTAAVHESTFSRLVREEDRELTALHVVDEPLLAEALTSGITPELGERVHGRLRELRDRGASVIVCTCSTLGGLAETSAHDLGLPVLRVDRPMAERAVRHGGRIGVVYAVESTAEPTLSLLRECIASSGATSAQIVPAPCLDAWPLFAEGDLAAYHALAAAHVRQLAPSVDVVVMAQASMAPVVETLADVGVPVLCSPATAVQRASALVGAV